MRKRTLVLGVVLLGLCLCLSASAESQSNEAVEFVKLLNEAENSFLDEDYAQAKTALGKAQEILEKQIGIVQQAEFFFDLSTPENALRSFLEASFLGDEETAKKCWSKRIPDYLISIEPILSNRKNGFSFLIEKCHMPRRNDSFNGTTGEASD